MSQWVNSPRPSFLNASTFDLIQRSEAVLMPKTRVLNASRSCSAAFAEFEAALFKSSFIEALTANRVCFLEGEKSPRTEGSD